MIGEGQGLRDEKRGTENTSVACPSALLPRPNFQIRPWPRFLDKGRCFASLLDIGVMPQKNQTPQAETTLKPHFRCETPNPRNRVFELEARWCKSCFRMEKAIRPVGLQKKDSRGDWTPLELFLTAIQGWEVGLRQQMNQSKSKRIDDFP